MIGERYSLDGCIPHSIWQIDSNFFYLASNSFFCVRKYHLACIKYSLICKKYKYDIYKCRKILLNLKTCSWLEVKSMKIGHSCKQSHFCKQSNLSKTAEWIHGTVDLSSKLSRWTMKSLQFTVHLHCSKLLILTVYHVLMFYMRIRTITSYLHICKLP